MPNIKVYEQGKSGGAFRVEVKVKNNLILKKIEKAGYPSVMAFCNKNLLSYAYVISLVNFSKLPVTESGEWRDSTYDLSSALHCEPEELFTESQRRLIKRKNKSTYEIASFDELQSLPDYSASVEDQYAIKEVAGKLFQNLTTREKIITGSSAIGETCAETAKTFGITRSRAAQINNRALEKMARLAKTSKIGNPLDN